MNLKNNKSGLILTEALVAVAILAIASIIITQTIKTALETTALSRHYLVAQNLATEAIEGVKSFRDTNWLKKPANHETCWMAIGLEVDTLPSDCSGLDKIGDNTDSYVITNTSDGWELAGDDDNNTVADASAADLDLLEAIEISAISVSNLNDFLVFVSLGEEFLNVSPGDVPPVDASASEYYRSVEVLEVNNDFAVFEVNVEWWFKNQPRKVERRFTIYNFD